MPVTDPTSKALRGTSDGRVTKLQPQMPLLTASALDGKTAVEEPNDRGKRRFADMCQDEPEFATKCDLWLSVTMISAHTEFPPELTMVPAKSLPDLYKKLLPKSGFGTVLKDIVTDHDVCQWYNKASLTDEESDEMYSSWKFLKQLGAQAACDMRKSGCAEAPRIGWTLLIVR